LRVIANTADKLAAFDELAPELRMLIDYGPLSPDSVFAAGDMQRDLGVAEAVRRIRRQIAQLPETWGADTGHTWRPEHGSPLSGKGRAKPAQLKGGL
jgi:hypothetical protein